mmetsp:Transcript_55529/g.76355  ORF Transcript_55529/g.76355 Transcript_55529/m.76355 type:complete len:152 (+) Transcript_55529:173-628(+)
MHGSFTTIFAAWNNMVADVLITVPWGFQESGMILGIILTFLSFIASYYTCYLVVITAGHDADFTDTVKRHFGKTGFHAAMFCFILTLLVPIILFFELLAQSLYPVILAIVESINGQDEGIDLSVSWSEFSYSWTCIIVSLLMFIMTSFKDL